MGCFAYEIVCVLIFCIIGMVSNATCLGRTPGFRQEHINAAFWLAVQS